MQFFDVSIDNLDLQEPDDFARCIVEKMCGKKYAKSDRFNYLLLEILKKLQHSKKTHTNFISNLNKYDEQTYKDILLKIDFNNPEFKIAVKEKNISRIIKSLSNVNPFEYQIVTLHGRDYEIFSKYIVEIHKRNTIDIHTFNEILLLLNQHKVSEGFFKYFFKKTEGKLVNIENIKNSITNFRGLGLLTFGNSRFAYKKLCMESYDYIQNLLSKHNRINNISIKNSTDKITIKQIPKNKTWYNGYISKKLYDKERLKLITELANINLSLNVKKELKELYSEIGDEIEQIEKKAFYNTDVYLSCSNLDVYVATSMRNKWDFENVSEFISDLFTQKSIIPLRLRYFDPTQSHCPNRIDKGLIEGLMLKRSKCTIYLVQEDDTLGKDSELASTLAQGKPVIAYIPRIDINSQAKKIMKFPLSYIKNRYYSLGAANIFDDEYVFKILSGINKEFKKLIFNFISEIDSYRESQPFSLWLKKEEEFKQQNKDKFKKICKIISTAEFYHYNKREETLTKNHPLAIQTHLESGVANGLLVVRNITDCSNLLESIFNNNMSFTINHTYADNYGFKYLQEDISKCIYRVETEYNKLTNSYWNLYFD